MSTRTESPDERIALLIAMIRRRWNLALGGELRALGVTARQCGVLAELAQADHGRSLDELVEALGADQSSLSRVVDRMERGGLVERVRHDGDRRTRRLGQTARGRRAAEPVRRIIAAQEKRLTAGLSAAEKERIGRDLGRLLSNLGG